MSVFYVFQGDTYEKEKNGGYVWSPQLSKSGAKNRGFTNMTKIRKGDFILHNANSKLVAISIAQTDCMEVAQPRELSVGETLNRWDSEGYKVDLRYYEFATPLNVSEFRGWLQSHYEEDSAFTIAGRGKQQYMCTLAETHAIFLINEAIKIQQKQETLNQLNNALAEIVGETESEYDQVEMDLINIEIDDEDTLVSSTKNLAVSKTKQEVMISKATGREIPKRNTKVAIEALKSANYKCEVDPNHQTFLRKNGTPYTEPHHLIPISKYKDFPYSLDVSANIVSLCSNCHNLLHYGRLEDKSEILEKIFLNRKDRLLKQGLKINIENIIKYY